MVKRFIWIFFYEYRLIQNAFHEFKIDSINVFDEKNYKLYTKETVGLHSAIYDYEWCNILFAKIIKFLKPQVNIEFFSPLNKHFKDQKNFF